MRAFYVVSRIMMALYYPVAPFNTSFPAMHWSIVFYGVIIEAGR
jgi:hypothetical protein